MIKLNIKLISHYHLVLLSFLLYTNNTFAQVDSQDLQMEAIQATENMLTGSGGYELSEFIDSRISSSYRESMTREAMLEHLQELREAVVGAGGVELAREDDKVHMIFMDGDEVTIVIQLSKEEPGRIDYLGLEKEESPGELSPDEKRNDALRMRVRGLESLSHIREEDALQAFIEKHLTQKLQNSIDREDLFSMLRTIGRASAGAGEVTIYPDSNGMRLSFSGAKNIDVFFELENSEPFRINKLALDTIKVEPTRTQGVSIEPITWENLKVRLKEEEKNGFSGTVLIVRNGKIVLHKGYGMANKEQGIPNTVETIFGIGSTAIDFTRAAVLKLQDGGKLSLSDTISCFFKDVPEDKSTMTLGQLMRGTSGLPNFHHDPEKDEDYDLSWIDREEAVNRILNAPLLFSPGKDHAHSHSAFVLLAAIIEVVTNQSYSDFLQENFFIPLGMQHTGFYGPNSGFNTSQMAVGYGPSKVGEVNIPLNWGPTSWLVMGSGGMVSNPGDMYKWVKAIHKDDILSEKAQKLYGFGNVYMGGSDRGFLFVYVDDPENSVFVSSNSHTRPGDLSSSVAEELAKLIKGENN
jgi:CubicO group peptidase (beta-lactamase class C family)